MINNTAILEEIKFRNDLEDVVSSYVTLKRAGSTLQGLCPFHSEKTPSFTVFPGSSSFYCFGCGAGGDVVTFIMRIENLEFRDALDYLAKRAGISLPDYDGSGGESVSRARLYEMNREAARFFFEKLKTSPAAAEYLNKRGLSGAVIKRFGLGYAPDGFDELTSHMRTLGYTDGELTAGALGTVSKKNGKLYDFFRNRVMFPIIDVATNVLAFGGRIIGEGEPKYLNSPDTPVFKKRRGLFALNFAKKECSERLILCEGYMDVVTLHAAGFNNAVATLGTAITPEQARLMKRHTKSVVISCDSDEAGQNAASKAFRLLDEVGLDVKVLRMEGAKDPDEYIKKFGAAKFSTLLDGSVSRFEFVISSILGRHNLADTEDKLRAVKETAEYIAGVYSAVERELYIAKASERLEIGMENLEADIERLRRAAAKEKKLGESRKIYLEASAITDRVNPDAAKNIRGAGAEREILGLLLAYPYLIAEVKKGNPPLSPQDFVTDFHRRIFETVMALEDAGQFDFGILAESFGAEEMGRITKLRLDRENFTKNDIDVLYESVDSLKKSGDRSLEDILNDKRSKKRGV